MNEELLKTELLKKDKEQLVELYLQKCYDTDVEIEQLKAELDEYKKHDNMCCSTLDEVIKNCDDCKLFECIGCEHSMSAVIEIKQLKAENEKLIKNYDELNSKYCAEMDKVIMLQQQLDDCKRFLNYITE